MGLLVGTVGGVGLTVLGAAVGKSDGTALGRSLGDSVGRRVGLLVGGRVST